MGTQLVWLSCLEGAVGTAAWGWSFAAASLWAGKWDQAGGGSGSAGSPLCHAGVDDKQCCGNKGFNMCCGEQQ